MNRILFYSINYDFLPTVPNMYKSLWIETRYPSKIKQGTIVYLKSLSPNFNVPSVPMKVIDVVGTRIVLDSKKWSPWNHKYHWGYTTRGIISERNWLYGKGEPVGVLIF